MSRKYKIRTKRRRSMKKRTKRRGRKRSQRRRKRKHKLTSNEAINVSNQINIHSKKLFGISYKIFEEMYKLINQKSTLLWKKADSSIIKELNVQKLKHSSNYTTLLKQLLVFYSTIGIDESVYYLQKFQLFFTKKFKDADGYKSFFLSFVMDPYCWIDNNLQIAINLLNKDMDKHLNLYSVLKQHDEFLMVVNPSVGKYQDSYALDIISDTSKPGILLSFYEIRFNIIENILKNKSFDEFYNTKITTNNNCPDVYKSRYQGKTPKEVTEANLLVPSTSRNDNWKAMLEKELYLDDSYKIKRDQNIITNIHNNSYFKGEKKLLNQYKGNTKKYEDISHKEREFSVEHHMYLFFKDVLENMPYRPNPTSNPEHEILIRGYLLKNGFVGPRPNTTKLNKKAWYNNQTLKVGEFVEQPNGSTAHPDLWVQLSNLRLSIEAKSNQGYYPMYGKTPPPDETIYLFSSKKVDYPNEPKESSKGRTTFTFGHQLLTDEIRDIMMDTKRKIKMKGKEMDLNIVRTGENYSSVGLSSDVNIQHIGTQANYWLGNRNIERERQVLSYNWLQPLGGCDKNIDSYVWDGPLLSTDGTKEIVLKCNNSIRNVTCACETHDIDFESSKPFVGIGFNKLLDEPYIKHMNGIYYEFKENDNKYYICYMCAMKYYMRINRGSYDIISFDDVVLFNNNVWYKIKYKNYEGKEHWQNPSDPINPFPKKVLRDLENSFWSNILESTDDSTKNLKIRNYVYDPFNEHIEKDEEYTILKTNSKPIILDMTTIPKIMEKLKKYNKRLYNLINPSIQYSSRKRKSNINL
jgi:hypothetical protein